MELSLDRGVIAQIIVMGRELERAEPEFRAMVDRLDEDEQQELVAIMWIGRGAFEPEDWSEALRTAEEEATTPCADYLIGTPHFSDHVEAGLEALGISIRLDEEDLF